MPIQPNARYCLYRSSQTVTPRGTVFCGVQANLTYISQVLAAYGRGQYPPREFPMQDPRANQVLVIHTDNWYVVPAPEVFSRHSGTCLLLGDRETSSIPYALKLGDCIRLGSVGLVISEYKLKGGLEERLDSSMIQFLKDEALAMDCDEDLAALAADENEYFGSGKYDDAHFDANFIRGDSTPSSPSACHDNAQNRGSVEKVYCYMCYDSHDTPDDRLIAPCNCKGDTRYLHTQCLQKWYFSSVSSSHALVIRTTGSGAQSCKICGAAYKSSFKNHDGRTANILKSNENEGAFLTLTVVTKHDSNPELFNSKFRMNFNGDLTGIYDTFREIPGIGFPGSGNSLLIGRSSACNMILDYRTVSTVHARIFYDNNNFYLQDNSSSNGTMVYIRGPMQLTFGKPITLRTGRSTIRLLAKCSWTAQFKSIFSRSACSGTAAFRQTNPSADDLYAIMVRASIDKSSSAGKRSPSKPSAMSTEIDRPVEEVRVLKGSPKGGLTPQGTIVASSNCYNGDVDVDPDVTEDHAVGEVEQVV